MAKSEREVLLDSGSLSDSSRVFEIPVGGELTFVALGLEDEDYVHFEMVYVPNTPLVDHCGCPPAVVVPPVVTTKAVVQYNGTPVILKKNNPIVVMSVPQGQPMRAVRHIANENDKATFRLTMQETKTHMYNNHVLGLIPWTVDDSADDMDGNIVGGDDYGA